MTTPISALPVPNDDTIRDTALALIEDNGSTTNLDIKTALRADGYFASQADVSEAMDRIQYDEGLHVEFNGVYRTFSFEEDGDGDAGNGVVLPLPFQQQADDGGNGDAQPAPGSDG